MAQLLLGCQAQGPPKTHGVGRLAGTVLVLGKPQPLANAPSCVSPQALHRSDSCCLQLPLEGRVWRCGRRPTPHPLPPGLPGKMTVCTAVFTAENLSVQEGGLFQGLALSCELCGSPGHPRPHWQPGSADQGRKRCRWDVCSGLHGVLCQPHDSVRVLRTERTSR